MNSGEPIVPIAHVFGNLLNVKELMARLQRHIFGPLYCI